MGKIITVITLAIFSSVVFSEPEIKGSPQDLRGFLHPAEKIVTITGEAEEKIKGVKYHIDGLSSLQ